LPPHKYCRSCGYTEFVDASVYASGYDIDCSKRERALCPQCGGELVGDGHNLDDTFFLGEWGDFAPSFSINVPEETHHQMLSWLAAQGKIQECASPKEIDAAEPVGLYAVRFLFISSLRLSVREGCLHPVDEFLQSDLAVGAFVPLDNGLVAPFLEVLFFDLADLEPGRIALVILTVDR
jgi:hypothetical protein